jgi:hypothetical protein
MAKSDMQNSGIPMENALDQHDLGVGGDHIENDTELGPCRFTTT